MDVDILLHIIGFCGIYFIIKNLQENVSRNETKFNRSRTDTYQVSYMKPSTPKSACPRETRQTALDPFWYLGQPALDTFK